MAVNNSLGVKMVGFGRNVMAGMRGKSGKLAQEAGEKMLKSNMTENQIRSAIKAGGKAGNKKMGEAFIKAADGMSNKVLAKGASQRLAKNMRYDVYGKAAVKSTLGYKIGDAIGGGYRGAYNSLKHGKNIKTALKAGFTRTEGASSFIMNGQKVTVPGKTVIRKDRVAGAIFGATVAGRVATGGGVLRDRYGRVNVPGVPFI